MNIFDRIFSDTPKFFKRIRNIGLVLTAVSGVILTAPVSLPAIIITGAGYMATAGLAAAAISQTVFKDEKTNP